MLPPATPAAMPASRNTSTSPPELVFNPAVPRPAALVFDLDGTLIDSRRDLAAAVNQVRGELGLPVLTLGQVVAMVGEGARVLVQRALGPEVRGNAFEEAFASFLRHYRRGCLDHTRPYPGVVELLARLAAALPLAVLTNKPAETTSLILARLGLAGYFRAVIAGDTLPTRKPDPAGLLQLARGFGVPAAALCLIGDSRVDCDTARAAGCSFVLVEWGFPAPPERAALAVPLRAATVGQLQQLLIGSPP